MKSGIDLSNYDTSPTTSEGYPRGAKSLADWIWKNFGKPTVIYASPTDFINNSNNKTGIFYQNTRSSVYVIPMLIMADILSANKLE